MSTPRIPSFIAALVALALSHRQPLLAYEELPPPANLVMPEARSPAESLAAITVAPGLQVELVAAEPMVMDPISLAWGADGRIWVVEMADYPSGLDAAGKPGGRIRVLESTKGDGHYDKSTLFADGLNYPSSVLPWRKGVLVTAAPDILYLEDTDGNGRADVSQKWFVGLGEGNQQHRANGLQWGLDGWLHLSNGDSGGKLSSSKTGQLLELGRRDLRLKPEEGLIEPLTGRSQFGRNRDDWGNWFGGNNSNPIWHYALDEHYLRRNTFLVPPNATVTVARIPGQEPVYPISQTLARFNDPFGANRFTSACSTMIYRDDLLGPEYAGNVFICEPVHNLVHRELIRPAGVTFTSERAPTEQTSEFLASTDNWSRFTSARTGPDGALYITDMYRQVIEHPQWIPAAWQKELGTLRAGELQGRIYRVYPKKAKLRPIPRLDRADFEGLVAALSNPSGTVRDLAQQQLLWRGTRTAAPSLLKLLVDSPQPQTRIQALSSLNLLGELTTAHVGRALRDSHPGVRREAVRLSDGFAGTNPELLATLLPLVDDPAATVRQQMAYSLGEWQEPAAGAALARLVRQNDDPFIIAAAMSSALPHAATMLAQMNAVGSANAPLIELAIATQNTKAIGDILANLSAPRPPSDLARQFSAMAEVVKSLRRNGQSLSRLLTAADPSLRGALDQARAIFEAARSSATDPAAPVAQRQAAVALLGQGFDWPEDDLKALVALLVPTVPVPLQQAAVKALGQIEPPVTPERLLAGWDTYAPDVRRAVLDLLISRVSWANALLDRLGANRAMLAQIDTAHRSALLNYGDARVAIRATELLGSGGGVDRQQVIDQYLTAMNGLRGDARRGQAVFADTCTACHQLPETGGRAIGPDLSALSDRSSGYLVTHILDPNRALEDRYLLYTVATNDGRTLAGVLTAETGNSITLMGVDGTDQVLLRNALKSIATVRRSLMPDGLEAAINPQAMADLVAFLAGAGHVPVGQPRTAGLNGAPTLAVQN